MSSAYISGHKCIRQANDMEENPSPSIFDIIDPTVSANSSFVLSVPTSKTKILTAFENEIRGSFLLIVKYHVMNTCTNIKQKLLREYARKSSFKNLPSKCNVSIVDFLIYALLARMPSIIIS